MVNLCWVLFELLLLFCASLFLSPKFFLSGQLVTLCLYFPYDLHVPLNSYYSKVPWHSLLPSSTLIAVKPILSIWVQKSSTSVITSSGFSVMPYKHKFLNCFLRAKRWWCGSWGILLTICSYTRWQFSSGSLLVLQFLTKWKKCNITCLWSTERIESFNTIH